MQLHIRKLVLVTFLVFLTATISVGLSQAGNLSLQTPTNTQHSEGNPNWSPDGEYIAFNALDEDGYDVWIIDSDGANPSNLTAGSSANESFPKWSPDGELIAYYSDSAGNGDIWIMSADGSNEINLTQSRLEDDGRFGGFSWSHDGQFIAFRSIDRANGSNISSLQIVHVNEMTLTTVIESDTDTFEFPAWSPDDSQLTFAVIDFALSDTDSEISLFSIEESSIQHILSGLYSSPSWSPSGDTLAILVADECNQGGADIALINAESLEITNLTEGQCPSTFRPPEWSPDGLYIVYETVEDGDPINPIQLSLLDLDQGVSIPLTGHFSSQDRNPEWSPDGNYITYVSDREGSLDIWKMNADGSDPINLTADLVE